MQRTGKKAGRVHVRRDEKKGRGVFGIGQDGRGAGRSGALAHLCMVEGLLGQVDQEE